MMRRLLTTWLFLSALPLATAKLSAEDTPAPVIGPGVAGEHTGFLVHDVTSQRQRGPTKIRVLLPQRLADNRRYPTVYVLPVEAGDEHRYGDGLAEIKRCDLQNKVQAIFVAPTFADLPWYADHPTDPLLQQEHYFVREVVPFIDETYPTLAKPEGRLLVGFSKSGWGAFSLLLRHPDQFGRAAAWDAPLMKAEPNQFGMGPIFGTQENFEKYQITRLLRRQAADLTGEPRLIHLGYGNFRSHHQDADALMKSLNISRIYHDGPHRKHAWESGWLREAVELLIPPGSR